MDRLKSIQIKNKIILSAFILSIILRTIFDMSFKVEISQIIILLFVALLMSGIHAMLIKKNKYEEAMYFSVFMFSISSLVMFKLNPTFANFLLFYYGPVLISLYQEKKVITLYGLATILLVTYSFFSEKDTLFINIGEEEVILYILYIVAATIILSFATICFSEINKKINSNSIIINE